MPDYGDEPYNPSDILPLSLAVIMLTLNGDLILLVAAGISIRSWSHSAAGAAN